MIRAFTMAALVLTLPTESASGCALDQAIVMYVQPDTLDVTAMYRCGSTICLERWVVLSNGSRSPVYGACLGSPPRPLATSP